MEALSSIGSFFGSGAGKGLGTLGELGLTGAGLIGNMSAERQRQQIENQLANPQGLANKASSMAQPLNAGLVQAINNQVGGTLAERGLSQSPGITATATSQALAPFEQQQINNALETLMNSLGLRLKGLPGNVNLAPLLALLGKSGTPGAGGGAPSWATGGMPHPLSVSSYDPTAGGTPPDISSPSPSGLGDFGSLLATPPDNPGWY